MPGQSFPFDAIRATEAAARVLQSQGRISRLRLIKFLYLADRLMMERHDRPICGGDYVAMPHGPVLSEVYDAIKGTLERRGSYCWSQHIENVGKRDVSLREAPPNERLSARDAQIIDEVLGAHGKKTDGQLYNFVHSLPEYRDPANFGVRVVSISLMRLMDVLGRSDRDRRAVLDHAQSLRLRSSVLS